MEGREIALSLSKPEGRGPSVLLLHGVAMARALLAPFPGAPACEADGDERCAQVVGAEALTPSSTRGHRRRSPSIPQAVWGTQRLARRLTMLGIGETRYDAPRGGRSRARHKFSPLRRRFGGQVDYAAISRARLLHSNSIRLT